jgi:hypothetical protein
MIKALLKSLLKKEIVPAIEVLIQGADFEENTLTVRLPDDFWDKYHIRVGTTNITIGDGIEEII